MLRMNVNFEGTIERVCQERGVMQLLRACHVIMRIVCCIWKNLHLKLAFCLPDFRIVGNIHSEFGIF